MRALLEGELGDAAAALTAARRAFEEGGPGRDDAEFDLRRLASASGTFGPLADAYQAAAGAGGDEGVEWLRKAARVHDVELSDGPGAITAWKAVLAAQPEDGEALEALERRYAEVTAVREQLEMALRRATLAAGEARVPALRHAADIARQAGDAEAEISSLSEARLVAPRDEAVLAALEEALARAGRSRGAGRGAPRHGRPGRRSGSGRAARRSSRGAPRCWSATRIRTGPSTPTPRCWRSRRGIRSRWPGWSGCCSAPTPAPGRSGSSRTCSGWPAIRPGSPRCSRSGWRRRRRRTGRRLLAEIAGLRERGGERGAAFATRLRAFEEAVAAGADDPAGAGRPGAAGRRHRRLGGGGQGLPGGLAAGAVGGRWSCAGGWPPSAANGSGTLDRAVAWWDEVAAVDPGPEPLAALVRLRRRQGAKRELVAALERLAEATPAPEAKKDLLFEVAKIMDEQLANREGAIEAYRKILSIDPEDPGALRLLGRLLGVAERWEELAAVMEREAEAAARRPDAAAEAAELRYRLGRIRQTRLADAAGALAAYRQVLERAPRHPGTLGALQELARTSGPAALDAALLLEPIYVAENEHARVIEVLEARVQNEAAPSARSALLRRISTLYGTQIRNGELAFTAAGRALDRRSRLDRGAPAGGRLRPADRLRRPGPDPARRERRPRPPAGRPRRVPACSWPAWSPIRRAPPRPGSGCWSWRRRTARRAPACSTALRGGPDAGGAGEGAAAGAGAGGAARGAGRPCWPTWRCCRRSGSAIRPVPRPR